MAKRTHPALVGLFVAGALVLIGAAIVTWGSRALFERKNEFVCYFPGSVEGLSNGAPVKYRGVDVGVVKEIKIRFRQAPDDKRIPVILGLRTKPLYELGGGEPNERMMQELVASGLRARVAFSSVVTGVAYVSLSEHPGAPLWFSELPGPGSVVEIPTLPRELDTVTDAVRALLAGLSTTDFKEMTESVSLAMHGINQIARSEDLQVAVQRLPSLLMSLRRLSHTLDADAGKAGEIADDVNGALASLRETLEGARGVVSPQAPLSAELATTLSDVDKAAVAVRELADFLHRNPHAIIAGTKPRGARP